MSTIVSTVTTTTSTTSTPISGELGDFEAAFDQTAAERAALAPNDLLAINLDIPSVVATVFGTLRRLKSLRDSIRESLSTFDVAQFDKIETYANALSFAHTAFLAASAPAEDLPELAERAMKVRETFASDATALAHRGLIDGKPLADLKGGPGYLNVAYDLGALVRMFRERWSEIASKSAIQASELAEAGKLYEQISRAYGARMRESDEITKAVDDRIRAFTLLVKAYDQARRAALYVRWEQDDADKFVPSLWAGRGGRHPSDKQGGTDDKTPAATSPTEPSAPKDGAAPTPPAVNGSSPATPVAPGLPGGSPFVNG